MIPLADTLQPLATPLLGRALSWREQQFQSMHEHFNSTDPWIFIRLSAGLAAVLIIFLLIKLTSYLQHRRLEVATKAQPFALFMKVQVALALPAMDRWRMWRMARALRLTHPAAVLISPVLFDRAVAKYKPRLSQRAYFEVIRARLFATL
jgi:hypothetical protein